MTDVSLQERCSRDLTNFGPFSLAFTSAIIFTLCWVFDPRWETNDDVGMSMIAHGYGAITHGSPNLIFSNVIWGYFVRGIPQINGVLGYSIATIAVLLSVGSAMLYFLLRASAGYLISCLAVLLIIARPTLLPQFTVNAGLLTAAAVIGWQAYARCGDLGTLIVSCVLAFCGYLVRWEEFFLVLAVAVPLLPWRALRERRLQIAFVSLSVAIAAAALLDYWSYTGEEWKPFRDLEWTGASFTDLRAGEHLKEHPEIMSRHGYSMNDIDLLGTYFYADPQLADPKSLNEMLAELGPLPLQPGNTMVGWAAIQALASPSLLPLLVCCLVLFVVAPSWPVAIAWVLFLMALFTLGLMGRPGVNVLRVYVPVLSLMLAAPIIFWTPRRGFRRWIVGFTLLMACLVSAHQLVPIASGLRVWAHQAQEDIKRLPPELIVAWGGSLPYPSAFTVFANDPVARRVRLYALGSDTLAPISVATAEERAGRGMLERLRTVDGVLIVASASWIELLRIYCREHFNSTLSTTSTVRMPSLTVQRMRCG